MMVMIFTGAIGSGKTTKLEKWVVRQKSIGGILMPVLAGERHLYSINSGKSVPVEMHEEVSTDEMVKTGKFNFSKKVFDWGNGEILNSSKIHDIIVIDEIGPLEMNKKGFYFSLKQILENKDKLRNMNLILVIREGMIEQITKFFEIIDFKVVSSTKEVDDLIL